VEQRSKSDVTHDKLNKLINWTAL